MTDSSFADFVGQSLPSLTRYAHALTRDAHAAEDLVQDTLVRMSGAWRRVQRGGNPIGYARTVLFRWETLTPLPGAPRIDWVATHDGTTVYAAAGTRLARSTDGGTTWAELPVTGLPDRGIDGIVLPDGDLLVTRAGETGGMVRLPAVATAAVPVVGAPAHANAFYETGGVLVAASVWDQRDTADLGSVAAVSDDGGVTWRAVPAP